mmetsp:Transcript_5313/g.9281  ORF Transcript_5313/g.9281 Transcript_5313/m.9281 type:complete len:264 (+) Transcript_5313:532-1323(+)
MRDSALPLGQVRRDLGRGAARAEGLARGGERSSLRARRGATARQGAGRQAGQAAGAAEAAHGAQEEQRQVSGCGRPSGRGRDPWCGRRAGARERGAGGAGVDQQAAKREAAAAGLHVHTRRVCGLRSVRPHVRAPRRAVWRGAAAHAGGGRQLGADPRPRQCAAAVLRAASARRARGRAAAGAEARPSRGGRRRRGWRRGGGGGGFISRGRHAHSSPRGQGAPAAVRTAATRRTPRGRRTQWLRRRRAARGSASETTRPCGGH